MYINLPNTRNYPFNYNTWLNNNMTNGQRIVYLESGQKISFFGNTFKNPANLFELYVNLALFSDKINASFNYWGSVQSEAEVIAKIFDFKDDSSKAIVMYWPFLFSPNVNDVLYNATRLPIIVVGS